MIPEKKLESLARRFAEINQLLCEPEVNANPTRLNELNRERGQLLPIVTYFEEWKSLTNEILETRDVLEDPELGNLARDELPALELQREKLEQGPSSFASAQRPPMTSGIRS